MFMHTDAANPARGRTYCRVRRTQQSSFCCGLEGRDIRRRADVSVAVHKEHIPWVTAVVCMVGGIVHTAVVIMRFQTTALLAFATAASAQHTYNITQAYTPGNFGMYNCL